MSYKHVGRIKKNKRKVIVAYRTVPGEPENCIVVTTQSLMADEHDALMKLVESDAGQNALEFAQAMSRASLPDGRNMLAALHTTGKMIKVKTNEVEMTPDRVSVISLDQLNELIATQRGVSVSDLAITDPNQKKTEKNTAAHTSNPVDAIIDTSDTQVLNDEDLAKKYREDSAKLYKEAKRLQEEADKLSPLVKTREKKNVKQENSTGQSKQSVKSTSPKSVEKEPAAKKEPPTPKADA